jgi:hypothetical protein
VPCAPELTALLHEHLEVFGTTPDGLLFRGVRGDQPAGSTCCRTWRRAREDALTASVLAGQSSEGGGAPVGFEPTLGPFKGKLGDGSTPLISSARARPCRAGW